MSDEVKVESHPSFGVLRICRSSGGDGVLFDSAVRHYNTIRMEICRADLIRDLSTNRVHATESLVEIEFSPAQFAEAITAMNQGDGSPCTIRRIAGECIPNPPMTNQRTQIHDEFKRHCKDIANEFDAKVAHIKDICEKKSLTKGDRQYILGAIERASMELRSNLPFVNECFNETIEKNITEAKAAVEAFFQATKNAAARQLTHDNDTSPKLIGLS